VNNVTVSREILWHFTCQFCSGTWSVAVMDEWIPPELYCTHCGKQQTNQTIRTDKYLSASYGTNSIDTSEDAIEPSVSDVESAVSINVVKKTEERLYAEDRMTHKVCEEGWWNPITKECQGEGNGHNVLDKDKDS
jgi:hypothetical protein